jgi:NAD-dependent dihydropyrimidine dehydrogenase PreA subunit
VDKPEECINCAQCDLRCPDMAITLEVVENG